MLRALAAEGDEVVVAEGRDPYFGGVSALSWLGGGADPRRDGRVELQLASSLPSAPAPEGSAVDG